MDDQVAAFVLRRVAFFSGIEMRLAGFAAHEFARSGLPEGLGHALIRFLLRHRLILTDGTDNDRNHVAHSTRANFFGKGDSN